MKNKIIDFLVLLLCLLACPWVSCADEIVLVADNWCPYNCRPDSDAPGFVVEIATDIFSNAGHDVIYMNLPWARAIQWVRNGEYNGLIGAGKKETPDFIFPETEIAVAVHSFFIKKDKSWRYDGPDSLKHQVVGVIRDYSYGSFFNDYISKNLENKNRIQQVSGQDGLLQLVRMLMLDRIDIILEDRFVFQYFLVNNSMPDNFIEAGVADNEKIYVAFSPNHKKSEEYARIMSEGIPKLRASGRLERILQKYHIKEWESPPAN